MVVVYLPLAGVSRSDEGGLYLPTHNHLHLSANQLNGIHQFLFNKGTI